MMSPASPRSHRRCHTHRELCEQVTPAHRIHRKKSENFTKRLLDKLKNYRKKKINSHLHLHPELRATGPNSSSLRRLSRRRLMWKATQWIENFVIIENDRNINKQPLIYNRIIIKALQKSLLGSNS
jgi:hypothetical protein